MMGSSGIQLANRVDCRPEAKVKIGDNFGC
jgi:hypothetical protein